MADHAGYLSFTNQKPADRRDPRAIAIAVEPPLGLTKRHLFPPRLLNQRLPPPLNNCFASSTSIAPHTSRSPDESDVTKCL